MTIGHNSDTALAQDILKQFVDSIEALEEEKKEIAEAISDKYAHVKSLGFDPKILRQVIKLRKMTAAERQENQDILDTYLNALGMLADTPLGDWAIKRAGDGGEGEEDKGEGEGEAIRKQPPAKPKAKTNPTIEGKTEEDAKEMGQSAAKTGKPVTSNPFPPKDPRRAAWDQEWCRTNGSDGLEIPEEFRRKDRKKDNS